MGIYLMAKNYHQGKFTPLHPEKYAGNVHDIVYRSGWELQLMAKLDRNPSVVLWNSEGLAIPYRSPIDGKMHRYFPDMLIKVRGKDGKHHTYLLEVKPHSQTKFQMPKKQTRKTLNEIVTYATNMAKWDAAKKFCDDQGWEFQVITEKDNLFG
jgi:hypothetical protein